MSRKLPHRAEVCCRLCLLCVLLASRCSAQAALAEKDDTQQRLHQLEASLAAAQVEIDTLRQSLRDLTLQWKARTPATVSEPTAASEIPANTAQAVAQLQESGELLAAQVKQHEQTKVESGSKFPVHLTGMVLFNAFANAGNVDVIDLPTSALRRQPGESHGSVGGSMRQTWLGLEGRGPTLGTLRTSARIDFDFFGAQTYATAANPTGVVRLRTAAVRAEGTDDLFEARFDQPLISPLSPASIASVAQPAMAWTGNLWTWAPELRWRHSFPGGEGRTLDVEAGVRDPYDAGAGSDQTLRLASPAERSRRPAYEGRLSYGHRGATANGHGGYMPDSEEQWRFGAGGYYARENYGGNILVKTWAITADWDLPLQRWLRLSGEAYRGTGLGGLGGGAYRDVVQGTDPATGVMKTLGLDAGGGWMQVQAILSPRLVWNSAIGQDAGSGSQLRLLESPAPSNPVSFYARNRALTTNLIYRPWGSFMLSPEYRRILSWPINGSANVANVFTLSVGYAF